MSIEELERLIGKNALDQLCRFYGGQRVYVPITAPPHHPLALVIGHCAAERLSSCIRGDRIEVPKNRHAETKDRNTELVQRYRAGESVRYLAAEYQLTERRIYVILQQEAQCQNAS